MQDLSFDCGKCNCVNLLYYIIFLGLHQLAGDAQTSN